nr:gluconate kinase [Chitinophagaceae bacterium]
KFISAKEYIFFRLFNQFIVDHSIASATGLFNIETLDWDPEALEFAGIAASQLSTPVPITSSITGLNEIYKTQIPLSGETLFIIGGSDGCMANLGSFAVNNNEAAITIGTSGAVRRLANHTINDDLQQLFQYRLDEKTFVTGGAINNGGIALQWFLDNFYSDIRGKINIGKLLEEIKKVPAGAEGLIFLPYVFGERSPIWDASATGIFSGIRSHHTKTHFLRAVIEGICFSLLQVMQVVEKNSSPIDTVFASGGFIQSKIWVQTLADILQKKIKINSGVDASALGAAFVAFKQMGLIEQWTDVKKFYSGSDEYVPDKSVAAIYQKNFKIYASLYPNFQKENS